jgi:hypothetical protein
MDSLSRLGLSEDERFWVTSKAIAGELLALAALFIVLQAGDPGTWRCPAWPCWR